MRQCNGCETDIDTGDGVTVIPAKTQADGSLTNTEWWHPDCRQVELRKITATVTRGRGGRKAEAKTETDAPQDEM